MTSAALIQCMSRSASGQASTSSLICQRARLHRDLDRVINQRKTKDHAEIRSLYGPGRRKNDRTPLGHRGGFDVYNEGNRPRHAEHRKIPADACGARVQPLDLRRGETEAWKFRNVQQGCAFDKIVEGFRTDLDRTGLDREVREAFRRTLEIDEDATRIAAKAATCCGKAGGVDRKADRCMRLVDAPALRGGCAERAGTAHQRKYPNGNQPVTDVLATRRHASARDYEFAAPLLDAATIFAKSSAPDQARSRDPGAELRAGPAAARLSHRRTRRGARD